MTNKLKILILSLTLIFNIQSSFCYTLNSSDLEKIINSKIEKQIQPQILKYSNDFKITIQGIVKDNIITNEKTTPKVEILGNNQVFQPNSFRKVLIKDSKNNIIKTFPITIQTKIYKNVLVAKDTIQYNSELNSSNTTIEKRDISKNLNNYVEKIDNNLIATRNYSKGSLILSSQIKHKATVLKNSNIDIIFLSQKGIRIKLQGIALKDGGMGDTILVRSNKYNKTYNAIVNSSNEVTVRI